MDRGINDSLKSRAYGVKSSYEGKANARLVFFFQLQIIIYFQPVDITMMFCEANYTQITLSFKEQQLYAKEGCPNIIHPRLIGTKPL
jgi:hypothetical protein